MTVTTNRLFVTIKSEKIRIYRWLTTALASVQPAMRRLESQAAMQEIEQELRVKIAALETTESMAVSFATTRRQPEAEPTPEEKK